MKRVESVYQRAVYLVSKPAFKSDIVSIRIKVGIPINGFSTEKDLEEWKEKHVYNRLDSDNIESQMDPMIFKIINNMNYGITAGWEHSIKRYIYLNDVDDMQLPEGIKSKLIYDKETNRPTIRLIIPEDVSRQEYIDSWESVKWWRNQIQTTPLKRQSPAYLIKRGKFAYDLRIQGFGYNEIAKELENKYGNTYTADDAKTIIKNFKIQAGI